MKNKKDRIKIKIIEDFSKSDTGLQILKNKLLEDNRKLSPLSNLNYTPCSDFCELVVLNNTLGVWEKYIIINKSEWYDGGIWNPSNAEKILDLNLLPNLTNKEWDILKNARKYLSDKWKMYYEAYALRQCILEIKQHKHVAIRNFINDFTKGKI